MFKTWSFIAKNRNSLSVAEGQQQLPYNQNCATTTQAISPQII